MKFGIVVAKNNKKAEDISAKVKKFLEGKGHESLEEDLIRSDLIITLGGDGTLIHAACANLELGVPVVGINLGKLGFLTACEADDWQKAIEDLISGKYFVSERMTLEASIGQSSIVNRQSTIFRAVNEVVIKGMYRVVDLEVTVKSKKFLESSGDGVIIATQTGSTAYSLSAGGPIVDPQLDCFVLTPVNAHGLPVPSVVLSPNDEIEIKVKEGENVSLIIDGQEHRNIEEGNIVKVIKGHYRVKLIYFEEHHIIRALNAKFGFAFRRTQGKLDD